MRAVMFLTIFILLSLLIAQIDAYLYSSNLINQYKTLLAMDPGSNKWMIYVFLLFGFLYSVGKSVKEKLQKIKNIGSK
ncbi:hypothetical protein AB3Z07_02165 [Metabacillus halosaccharovorans]|uniref:hypothetical protein n=1 Tax=Metabacillus halosaccharovorans TaxID=930124 RepID=UPI00099532B1|nr:hypothetical protein [Metabacillus halosaccharovorans]MCM3442598.1 hypothetical protein [Metabacillus halosaccharovorans]